MNDDQKAQNAIWMKESEQMWLTDKFVDRPGTVLIIAFIPLMAMAVLSTSLGYFDIAPQNDRDFLIWDDPIIQNFDKLNLAKDYIDKYGADDSVKPIRVAPVELWATIILYESENADSKYGLLEKENLLKMQKIETDF